MSERISNAPSAHMDVDSAFDPEKRQAQSEWDSYLEQRDYEDKAGNLHDARTGQFKSNPNNETDDDYYNRIHAEAESEVDTRFAGKGLKSLAEMVRDARAAGDKTAELDAREAFDNAFIAEAEKQGWEGVVEHEDGTIDDRNEIADRRLRYFEGIMDSVPSQEGESANAVEEGELDSAEDGTEEYTGRHRGEAEPTGEDAAEAEEYTGRHRGGKSEAEEYTGRHRGEAGPTGEDAAEAEEYTGRHRAAEGSDLSGEEINTDWVDGHVDGELELLADDGAEEINTDWVDEYVDNERELLAGARGWARRHWALLRRSGGLGNYAGGELHTWMSNRSNPNHEKTKDKRKWIAGFIGGAAVLVAGALLIRGNQHELATTIGSGSGAPGGSGGNTLTNDAAGLTGALETPHGEMPEMPVAPDAVPDVADTSEVTPEMLADFTTEKGHGFTHEWKQWGEEHGFNIDDKEALGLHKHLLTKFGKDGLINTPTYLEGTDVRISVPGPTSWRPGVVEEAVTYLRSRGL